MAKAERFLAAAHRAMEQGDVETAISRAYYAVFHAVIAVLETKEGVVRTNWSHNFRPFYERYTYLEGLRRPIGRLYEERLVADYRNEDLDAMRSINAIGRAITIRQRLLEVLRSG